MLRITKEADYGIMLLGYFSSAPVGTIRTAREAARWSGIPLPMVGKILRNLARAEILTSHRGASGGYSFERTAAETSVAEVIRAVEGPISLVQCGTQPGACEQEACCPTRPSWARINVEIERALERIPISEMVGCGPAQLLPVGLEKP